MGVAQNVASHQEKRESHFLMPRNVVLVGSLSASVIMPTVSDIE